MHKKIKIFTAFDKRGSFKKIIDNQSFKQFFISNSKKNVFRGFHYYGESNKSDRIIYLIKGEIDDFIVDLREKFFGNVHKIKIKENSNYCYKIPYYFAHGFYSVKKSSLAYFFDKEHKKKIDKGIFYKSVLPNFAKKKLIISSRDKKHPKIQFLKSF